MTLTRATRLIPRLLVALACLTLSALAAAEAKRVQTPYGAQKVVMDFYLDDPRKMDAALYWIRALINPLMDAPYDYAPELLDIVVVIHGTEVVTTVAQNYDTYRSAVERMKYYAELGVRFRVCGMAAEDYGYPAKDFYDFIEIVPSAITELAHWQLEGYALITPKIMLKERSIEEIR